MKALATLTALAALAVAFPAQAEFQLGSRYVDNDGDLIADIPEDSADWIDPDTLIFAYTPVEDPAVYAEVWQGFLDHMAEVTGKNVQFFPVQSNAAQIEAIARRSPARCRLQHRFEPAGRGLRRFPSLRHDGC